MPQPKVPRVCFDRVLPQEVMRFQNVIQPTRGPLRAVSPIGKQWINGSTLRVRFLGGTAAQQALVHQQAGWWTQHAHLKFDFNNALDADIRISFDPNDGAWSYVGTDAKFIPAGQATMNLGFLDGGTVAHEFGHAIGLAHEHQNPAGGIQWNEALVIKSLGGSPNFWPPDQARHNVLAKYAANQVRGTNFDPHSIMLYFFPAEWTTNGIATKQNQTLSATDAAFVASAHMYPKTEPGVEGAVPIKISAKATKAAIGKAGEEDLFRFVVAAGGRHTMETSGPTDVVMKLFGPNSPTALIAEDDDSGADANARITANLVAGEYYVQVRHWNRAAGTGNYSLRVKRG